ncbi:MAG TPA: response regulator [Treponemataceae bacterium]|nr:response regulator [Treponemataceae bacterium]
MYTVLIVDDEEPVIESYSFILEQGVDGFTLAGIARSGPEAVARINELSPDVVFMDINMPGFDGLEAISRVHECFPNTIFVLSTAYERFDIARKAIPLGVYAYLVKPVTRQLFVETLAGIKGEMEKRRASLSIGQSALLADRFLRETIWKAMDESSWREHRQTLHLDSDKGWCVLSGSIQSKTMYILVLTWLLILNGNFFLPCT